MRTVLARAPIFPGGLAAVSGIAAVASLVVVAGRRREEPLDAPYLSMEASV